MSHEYLQAGDLALDDDPLARGQCQPSRWTFRFAKSTFDALIHFRRNERHGFEMRNMMFADPG